MGEGTHRGVRLGGRPLSLSMQLQETSGPLWNNVADTVWLLLSTLRVVVVVVVVFCCCCYCCFCLSLCYCRSHTLGQGGKVLFYKHCCPLYVEVLYIFLYTLFLFSLFISPSSTFSFLLFSLFLSPSLGAAAAGLCEARYMQPAQPHLTVFSTSSLKEVPSLHSKVYFRRFIRWLAQQVPVSQAPEHSTQETMRVVWQMA